MFTTEICQCRHEIDNNLQRTKFCFIPCRAQRGESRSELKESLANKLRELATKDREKQWETSSDRQDLVQEIYDIKEKLNPDEANDA
jgi:hypothetical protein